MEVGSTKPLRILIIEDDQVDRTLIERLLSKSSLPASEVESVGSLDDAFQFLDKNHCDVVLLDLNLPDSNGIDTIVRVTEKYPHVATVVIAGECNEEVGPKVVATGAEAYLTKDKCDMYTLSKSVHYAIERKRTKEILDRKQKNLEAIFDAVSIGMLLVDEKMIVKRANNAIEQMVHRQYSQIINRRVGGALCCVNSTCNEKGCGYGPACAVCSLQKMVESVLDSGQSVHGLEIQPSLRVDSKKITPWFRISAEPAIVDRCKHVVITIDDITERKQSEQMQTHLLEELKNANSQIENVNEELKDFAYIVSHDLKAPLRGIKTLAEWISTDYADKLGEDGRKQMELLLDRVDRMHRLIDGVLEYSRVGFAHEEKAHVNLNELVSQVIDIIVPPENIEIIVENELPTVECQQTRIMQVFQNLLSNAIKYMDKPQGRIRIGCVEENRFWKFSIADNGPGIEEKNLDRIFKIFQMLASCDTSESSGIGLTLVRKIVHLYGGKIWVESKLGEGSTFFFTLPTLELKVENAKLQASIVC